MFTELKFKLTFIFTAIVGLLKFVFGAIYIWVEYAHSIISVEDFILLIIVMLAEIVVMSVITFVIGYFFINSIIDRVEKMFIKLEQFTQDASHELKTPLAIANSSLDLAKKTKDYDVYINEAKQYIRQASTLVEKMLDMARMDEYSMNVTSVSVRQVIERLLETYREQIQEKKLHISVHGNADIMADYILAERCFGNLIENAIKYNKKNGSVEIRIERKSLEVCNTGAHIEDEHLEHIFERFFTTNISRSQKGYGIGLALVKQICIMHGWKVNAFSSKEKTKFTIFFGSSRMRELMQKTPFYRS